MGRMMARGVSPHRGDASGHDGDELLVYPSRQPHSTRRKENSVTTETPVLDTLAEITAASLEHNALAPRELMLVRMAALIAMDAPPASYLRHAGDGEASRGTAADLSA